MEARDAHVCAQVLVDIWGGEDAFSNRIGLLRLRIDAEVLMRWYA